MSAERDRMLGEAGREDGGAPRVSWWRRNLACTALAAVALVLFGLMIMNSLSTDYRARQRNFFKDIGREDLAQREGLVDDQTAEQPVSFNGRLKALEREVLQLRLAVLDLQANCSRPTPGARGA